MSILTTSAAPAEPLPEHWVPIGLLGVNASFQRAAREYAEEYAKVALAAAPASVAAEGWKLVPIEPTPEMCEADWNITMSDAHSPHGVAQCAWEAMLKAAPTPQNVEISQQPAKAVQADASRDELIDIARSIEALKLECGMDPESPRAIQNGRYMSIAYKVRALALRAAPVAEQPIAKIHSDGYWTRMNGWKEPLNFHSVEVYAAAQPPVAEVASKEAEPVAWRWWNERSGWCFTPTRPTDAEQLYAPLYTRAALSGAKP